MTSRDVSLHWRSAVRSMQCLPQTDHGREMQREKMLADLVENVEHGVNHDPIAEALKVPIEFHINDFEQHLIAKDNTPLHVRQTVCRVERYIIETKRRSIDKIDVTSVEGFLAKLRKQEKLSLETCNHYIRALKSFCKWLVKANRLLRHPLLSLSLFNADSDRRHARRPLDATEFQYLLRVASAGEPIEQMSGEDRHMFYILASWTGFRKGELGSVTPRHFKLDGEYPTLMIHGAYSKRRREDTQFLHPDVVTEFKIWVSKKKPKPDEILFPVSAKTCGVERKTSKMLELDLQSAREVWINESNSAEERESRESSDFLKYVDSHGKFADFHGLRHVFCNEFMPGQRLAENGPTFGSAFGYQINDANLHARCSGRTGGGDQVPAGSRRFEKRCPVKLGFRQKVSRLFSSFP